MTTKQPSRTASPEASAMLNHAIDCDRCGPVLAMALRDVKRCLAGVR
jgi:hypothetical protein